MRPALLACLAAPLLLAQTQPTFYAAYQDGLEAERQGQWKAASAAFRRAIELRPAPAARVLTYGNNLLTDYAPHTRLARCLLRSGELEASAAALEQAAARGEPRAERETIAQELAQARASRTSLEPAARAPQVPSHPAQEPPSPTPPPPSATPRMEPAVLPDLPRQTPVIETGSVRGKGSPPRVDPPPPAVLTSAPAPAPPPDARPTVTPRTAKEPGRLRWIGWPVGLLLSAVALFAFLRRRKLSARASSYQDPEQLGPYRIERLLGRGGFASTYLARHMSTRQPVAVKVLHPYRQDDPEFLRRFRLEAKLGAMLDHPNLVRLLDPGPETGIPWLAMEFISGRRLDQVLKEVGPPPLPELLRVALQIAGAVAHAHTLGIVHRDLKPGNVIFAGDQVKVMDFGISRIVDSNTLTTTYAFLGTPRYAAPEAQLKSQVGPAADSYAFGIMLFEMLTGATPFDGETPFDILDQHRKTPLPDLAALRPDAPPALVDLVGRLCRKDPDQRPGDEEVLTVLTGLAAKSLRA